MDRFNKIWTTVMLSVLAGIGLGIILNVADPHFIGIALYGIAYIAIFVMAFILHIIAHEGGHLLGGLLSGYEFVSFRVFNIVILKRNGKLQRKKFHMVGTGGQCLMAPPQPYRPDYPYKIYNLAGGLANLIIAAVCVALSIPVIAAGQDLVGVLMILLPLAAAGLYCGITNLIPMMIGGVPNDGWNLAHLGKDPEARRILWLLLDVMAIISRGGQFRDMPEDWFAVNGGSNEKPDETASVAKMKPDYRNTFQCSLGIFRLNYLIDTGRLEEAADLADEILRAGNRVPQIYRYELLCESIFWELIGEGRLDRVERLYTPELQRYIRATDSYPHRQRLHYAMAMLYHRDETKAAKALSLFEKACKTYPNEGEISSEWELLGLVDCKLAELNALAQQAAEEVEEAAQLKLEDLADADSE
jgi:tetratricopeptide (TPR) repeat protein